MLLATELAIRAVVRGLFHSEAIDADQVRGVMSALPAASDQLIHPESLGLPNAGRSTKHGLSHCVARFQAEPWP